MINSAPQNGMIVNGVNLYKKYGMILCDGYSIGTPEIKKHTIDIPGGDGYLDLTESLSGDVSYSNRQLQFTFIILDVSKVEQTKSNVLNFIHGREYDFALTMDPEYTYHGRFNVGQIQHGWYANHGNVLSIQVTIDADPYKRKNMSPLTFNCVGGSHITLKSGRKRVNPTIQVSDPAIVVYKGKKLELEAGTWRLNDVLLKEGTNKIYINSFPIHNYTWRSMKNNTWKKFKEKELNEWYTYNGETSENSVHNWNYVLNKFKQAVPESHPEETLPAAVSQNTVYQRTVWNNWWDSSSHSQYNSLYYKWGDFKYMKDMSNEVKPVVISYEWGDL